MANQTHHGDCCQDKTTPKKVAKIVGWTIGGIFLAAFFGLIFGFIVMKLWNWLMPEIFHLTKITYWQAFGLIVLAKLFFGCPPHHAHDKSVGKEIAGTIKNEVRKEVEKEIQKEYDKSLDENPDEAEKKQI